MNAATTQGITEIELWRFAAAYLLIAVVLVIMRASRISQGKLLLWASVKMTVQLALAGAVLSYLIDKPNPVLVALYIAVMFGFAIHRILSQNPGLNRRFKWIVAASLVGSNTAVIAYFITVIVGENLLNPQYAIPLAGIILGNAMTGIMLGLKTFQEMLANKKPEIQALLNCGTHPADILRPLAHQAVATAMLPTINSMLGMGIIFLPGMMTGQILGGTYPLTAIMYQIAIMLALSAIVSLSVYASLYFGYRTLYNDRAQITY